MSPRGADPVVRWPSLEPPPPEIAVPAGYTLQQLGAHHVPELIQQLESWYPAIHVGAESCHLRGEFYLEQVHLAGAGLPEKNIAGWAFSTGGRTVALVTVERNLNARTLAGRLGVVHPAHRGNGLSLAMIRLMDHVALAMGMELISTFATLAHPLTQRVLEQSGYRLAGIVPGYDRDMVHEGTVRRVYEALYVKLLVPTSEIEQPSPDALTPGASALLAFLSLGGRTG
jgi:hypothetical protein